MSTSEHGAAGAETCAQPARDSGASGKGGEDAAVRPRIAGLIVVALAGLAIARMALGSRPYDLFDTDWLWGDLAQVYFTWTRYLRDVSDGWLSSNLTSYPLDISISLFDPMPILLVALSPLAGLVPDGIQLFGVYFSACLVLQGCFGYLAVSQVVRSGAPANTFWQESVRIAGGLFFALAPYTMFRFVGHTALSSQWVMALAIWTLLATRDWRSGPWIVTNGAVMLLASGLNPYLALMVGLCGAAVAFFDAVPARPLRAVIRIGSLGAAAALGLYAFGFLSGAGVTPGGYGVYSMNMLGPLDSNGQATLFPLDVPDPTGGQAFEGFEYLGLGLLLLIGASLGVWLFRPGLRGPLPLLAAAAVVVAS